MRNRTGTVSISELRGFAGERVSLLLGDGSEHHGKLRTELLTDQSISVFIAAERGEGATIYINQIPEICVLN